MDKLSLKSDTNFISGIEKIQQILKEEKNLQIRKSIQKFKNYENYFFTVQDNNDEYYLIKIISIFDETSSISQEKLQKAQSFASFCKQCNYTYVIKYKEEFLIDKYFCILFENCESFDNWISEKRQKEFHDSIYLKYVLQILEGVNYFHSKKIYLNDETLQTLMLDKNLNVNFISFEYYDEQAQYEQIKQVTQSSTCNQNQEDTSHVEDEYLNKQHNIRIIADCKRMFLFLYRLAGATRSQMIEIEKDKNRFQIQLSINHEINFVIKNAIQLEQIDEFTLQGIIDKFQKIHNQEKQDAHQENEEEQNQFKLVQQLFYQNQLENATEIILKLIESNPKNDVYLAWIGRCCNSLKNNDFCQYWSLLSLKINENNEMAYFNLGNYYKVKYDYKKSIEYFKKSIKINPFNTLAYNNLATTYYKISQLINANSVLKTALRLNRDSPNYNYNLSRSYYIQQNYETSLKYIRIALRVDSVDQDSQLLFNNSKRLI